MNAYETKFEVLLDIVEDALGDTGTQFPPHARFDMVPTAANDNGLAWPLLPFPDDWFAS